MLEKKQLIALRQSQWWSQEVWEAFQLAKLLPYLQDSFKNVPYYRDLAGSHHIAISEVRSLDDFRELPRLSKASIRGNETAFIPDYLDHTKLQTGSTSGTTGTPMTLYSDPATFARRWGFVARLREIAGVHPHNPKRCQFTGRDISPNDKRVFWRVNLAGNSLLMSTTQINRQTAPSFVAAMNKWKPELLDGYPSAMLVLARFAQELDVALPQPKAIITSAETLTEADRSELQERYRCNVFDQYASSEASAFWSDCEFGTMHINEDFGISEILDSSNRPSASGTTGRIVTTALVGAPMRLIRYEIGDLAETGNGITCRCGRTFRTVGGIDGRIEDIIDIPGRGAVGRLDPAFKGLGGIIESQIAHVAPLRVEVRLVRGPEYTDQIGSALLSNLHAKLGNEVDISLTFVEQIPRSANGKMRAVVKEFA
jgi:phenylacetate-CoA ligase